MKKALKVALIVLAVIGGYVALSLLTFDYQAGRDFESPYDGGALSHSPASDVV